MYEVSWFVSEGHPIPFTCPLGPHLAKRFVKEFTFFRCLKPPPFNYDSPLLRRESSARIFIIMLSMFWHCYSVYILQGDFQVAFWYFTWTSQLVDGPGLGCLTPHHGMRSVTQEGVQHCLYSQLLEESTKLTWNIVK